MTTTKEKLQAAEDSLRQARGYLFYCETHSNYSLDAVAKAEAGVKRAEANYDQAEWEAQEEEAMKGEAACERAAAYYWENRGSDEAYLQDMFDAGKS